MMRQFEQADLGQLGEKWIHFANSAARDTRKLNLSRISRIEKRGSDDRIWVCRSKKANRALKGIKLLMSLRDLSPYASDNLEISRMNADITARIGAIAVRRVHQAAEENLTRFSPNALAGLQNSLGIIHDGIVEAFNPTSTPHSSDQEAMFFLEAAGHILGRDE